jgi:hypothetical protein
MKVFQVSYDTVTITMIVESKQDMFDLLLESDTGYRLEDDKLYFDWDESFSEECFYEDVTNQRGIIQYEQH